MSKPDPVWKALERVPSGPRRSALAQWMFANHDALQAKLGGRRADWTALAAAFAEAGVMGRGKAPPTPNTARVTWQRVRKAVAAERAMSGPVPAPAVEIGRRVRDATVVQPASGSASGDDPLASIRAEMNARSGRKPNAS